MYRSSEQYASVLLSTADGMTVRHSQWDFSHGSKQQNLVVEACAKNCGHYLKCSNKRKANLYTKYSNVLLVLMLYDKHQKHQK